MSLSTPAYHDLTAAAAVGMLPCHNAPIAGPTLGLYTPPALPPVIQLVAGPPRILPHHRTWSGSRIRRERSRSQPVNRALSPLSTLVKPPLPQLSQTYVPPSRAQAQAQSKVPYDISLQLRERDRERCSLPRSRDRERERERERCSPPRLRPRVSLPQDPLPPYPQSFPNVAALRGALRGQCSGWTAGPRSHSLSQHSLRYPSFLTDRKSVV